MVVSIEGSGGKQEGLCTKSNFGWNMRMLRL